MADKSQSLISSMELGSSQHDLLQELLVVERVKAIENFIDQLPFNITFKEPVTCLDLQKTVRGIEEIKKQND